MVASQGEVRGRLPELAKYDIVEEIGHGGMATVYRARDPRLSRDVAIKVIHPHLRDSPEVAHRFHVEAQAVAKLRHANIVEVYDVSAEEDREQYLVVELVRGKTLRKVLQERSPMPPEVAAAFAMELLAALSHAHAEGVVHRDIKPENVLVESSAQGVKVKLTDFGIAKLLDSKGVTSTGQVLGSPAHMAPEQIEGGDVDARSDVFGLGVLLYECMVGHLPFEGANPAQVLRRVLDGHYSPAEMDRPTVGKAWSVILDRALAHEAGDRWESAADMRKAIATELTRLGIGDAKEQIASYLEDPEAYEAELEQKLVDRLCETGAAARKAGNVLLAANDYNRALAYAPSDPGLLKVVSTMHRASARTDLVKRGAPAVGLLVAATCFAFFVTRALKGNHVAPPQPLPSAPVSVAGTGPSATPSADVSAATSAKPPTSAPSALAVAPSSTNRVPAPPPQVTTRNVVLVSVKPVNGVSAQVDQDAPVGVTAGSELPLDAKPHVIQFTCALDACEPKTITVPAGKEEFSTGIELAIRDAKLIVEGDAKASYGILENPQIDLKSGVSVSVPCKQATNNNITIVDRADPSRRVSARLSAGKLSTVAFPAN